MFTRRPICMFAAALLPWFAFAEEPPALPLPELPKLEAEKEIPVMAPLAESKTIPPKVLSAGESAQNIAPPELPVVTPPAAFSAPITVVDSKPSQKNEKGLNEELAMPPIPGNVGKEESFPVKPEAQKPTLELVDQIFGKKKPSTKEQTQDVPPPPFVGDDKPKDQMVVEKTAKAETANDETDTAKPAKKRKKHKKFGIKSTGELMFGYKSQFLPETVYMEKYPRGNRFLPKAQYEQSWDRLMFVTAVQNNINGLRALMQTGRAADMRDEMGQTPLIAAIRYNALNTARLLLARGANPNVMDNAGNTPLHYAIANNNYQAVMAILEMGGKPDLADSRGVTAFMMAEQTQNPLIRSAMGL